jgi:hypothetical protein
MSLAFVSPDNKLTYFKAQPSFNAYFELTTRSNAISLISLMNVRADRKIWHLADKADIYAGLISDRRISWSVQWVLAMKPMAYKLTNPRQRCRTLPKNGAEGQQLAW